MRVYDEKRRPGVGCARRVWLSSDRSRRAESKLFEFKSARRSTVRLSCSFVSRCFQLARLLYSGAARKMRSVALPLLCLAPALALASSLALSPLDKPRSAFLEDVLESNSADQKYCKVSCFYSLWCSRSPKTPPYSSAERSRTHAVIMRRSNRPTTTSLPRCTTL